MLTHAVEKFHLTSPELALTRSKKAKVVGEKVDLFLKNCCCF